VVIEQRILKFVNRTNWVLICVLGLAGTALASHGFAVGIVVGGLIVTINFHLLSRTLRKALTPPHLSSPKAVLVKYYLRFTASGAIIFILIFKKLVDPYALVIGLSVVVMSIMLASIIEFKKLLFKEAV
jgi:hypothetical protein